MKASCCRDCPRLSISSKLKYCSLHRAAGFDHAEEPDDLADGALLRSLFVEPLKHFRRVKNKGPHSVYLLHALQLQVRGGLLLRLLLTARSGGTTLLAFGCEAVYVA